MQVTETKLRCDKTIEALFLSSSQSALGVAFGEYDKSILSTCAHELIEKLVNACKKNWDVTRRRFNQHAQGRSTDVTLNLRDILKAHVAK